MEWASKIGADTIIIILASCTLITAIITFLAQITGIFKKQIPLDYGFLVNDQIKNSLEVATGDPAKNIWLRFRNPKKNTLTGVVTDIHFIRPLTLSPTNEALTLIKDKTFHGKSEDNPYYQITHTELNIAGHQHMDFRVQLDTKGKSPGNYTVKVTAYSTQQDYKFKESDLTIIMK